MIFFMKNRINVRTDSLQSAIIKKIKNKSLSNKTLGKLVQIANTQYELKNGEAAYIFKNINHVTDVNYEKVSRLIKDIKGIKNIKSAKNNFSTKYDLFTWKLNAKELLTTKILNRKE